ncbi:MAG: hypothetical protein RR646_07615 [Erysipelotrichaceae bacterium]
MNIKRRVFALFICLFGLVGCMNAYASTDSNDDIVLAKASDDSNTSIVSKSLVNHEVESVVNDYGDDPGTIYAEYDGRDGYDWIATQTFEGSTTKEIEDFHVTKDNFGHVISRTAVLGSKRIEEAKPAVMQFGGNVEEGAEFFPKTTTYGVDCVGCYHDNGMGSTAMSIKVDANRGVQQPSGVWAEGIKYGDYYIIAADTAIPLCSVIEISDHGYSGEGLSPEKPFKAIVLDRGGGVSSGHLDLFVGSEKAYNISIDRSIHSPKATIKRVGGFVSKGVCSL